MSRSADLVPLSAAAGPSTGSHSRAGSTGGCGCGCGDSAGGCGCGSGSSCSGCALHGPQAVIGLERTRFYPRQLVTPDDLTQDQIHLADKLRRHNRLLHGWGLVCGLTVKRADGHCRVTISAGMALDPYGNEIVVPTDVQVDLCQDDPAGGLSCVPPNDPWCQPVPAVRPNGTYFLALRHVEELVKPVRAPTGCACDDSGCELSRIRDGFEVTLLAELPPHYERNCSGASDPCSTVGVCAPCPESGWVVLATVEIEGPTLVSVREAGRQHVISYGTACIDCTAPDEGGIPHLPPRHPILFASVPGSDTVLSFPAVLGDRLVTVSIGVPQEGVDHQTALHIKEALDQVPVMDVDRSIAIAGLTAGSFIGASPLFGDSVIDNVDDLAIRLGRPIVDPTVDAMARKAILDLLTEDGRNLFAGRYLGDRRRAGSLAIGQVAGLTANGLKALGTAGVATLADLLDHPGLSALNAADTKRIDAARAALELAVSPAASSAEPA